MNNAERKLMTTPEVMARLLYKSRSAFQEFCENDKVRFPKPIRLGLRRKGWFEDEVEAWIDEQDRKRHMDDSDN
ncbi:AlpA family phage regulatory protein [Enterobacter hormaechei subsp. hoffmannii]|nr:AlpA family phage regulatory protein [Enterobacter hormaechei subsp. hoffmannii]